MTEYCKNCGEPLTKNDWNKVISTQLQKAHDYYQTFPDWKKRFYEETE